MGRRVPAVAVALPFGPVGQSSGRAEDMIPGPVRQNNRGGRGARVRFCRGTRDCTRVPYTPRAAPAPGREFWPGGAGRTPGAAGSRAGGRTTWANNVFLSLNSSLIMYGTCRVELCCVDKA